MKKTMIGIVAVLLIFSSGLDAFAVEAPELDGLAAAYSSVQVYAKKWKAKTALADAIMINGSAMKVKEALKQGANVNDIVPFGLMRMKPLMALAYACGSNVPPKNGETAKIAELLIGKGASPTAQEQNPNNDPGNKLTVLMLAVWQNCPELVSVLLSYPQVRKEINRGDSVNVTALDGAYANFNDGGTYHDQGEMSKAAKNIDILRKYGGKTRVELAGQVK